ncbi:histidine phosphatase family protein [Bacillus carboniphilus]|uniref:Histidine phosphatase family protein n=1 Tax=Bacillus carboniphilus TaxID=86663 RepID=A0ABY9JUI5_9BACI|nr:histidine phosphatase family protein [Bacillus carboniphilus]WLR42090.1 histidine phosphatase family protein [Bacillus carboniphilus]
MLKATPPRSSASFFPYFLNTHLKERIFSNQSNRMRDEDLLPLLEESFANLDYSFNDGESNRACQNRAIMVLKELLNNYEGKKIAIGTHGAVMTLMMAYYDSKYNLDFLRSLSKPDLYKMEFSGQKLLCVERLWS